MIDIGIRSIGDRHHSTTSKLNMIISLYLSRFRRLFLWDLICPFWYMTITLAHHCKIPLSMRKNWVDVIFPDITSFILIYLVYYNILFTKNQQQGKIPLRRGMRKGTASLSHQKRTDRAMLMMICAAQTAANARCAVIFRNLQSAPVRSNIAIRLKIQTKSSHKTHKSQLLRLDFVNLNSWIAISSV